MKVLWILVIVLTPGCVLGLLMPTPGHSVVIEVDQDISSPALTEQLLAILQHKDLPECRAPVPCNSSFWQSPVTPVDPSKALIEIGSFPSYKENKSGHAARIKRTSADRLKLTVKGVGPYFSDVPNEAMAIALAQIIKNGLAQ